MRERNGTTLPFVVKAEVDGVDVIAGRVAADTVIHADEASHWNRLHAHFDTRCVNHSEAYGDGNACTNMAESFFSRLRRAEVGTYRHIAGPYLHGYANEMAWREDNHRISNGDQFTRMAACAVGIRFRGSERGIGNGRSITKVTPYQRLLLIVQGVGAIRGGN
jgi:hypothetical protein